MDAEELRRRTAAVKESAAFRERRDRENAEAEYRKQAEAEAARETFRVIYRQMREDIDNELLRVADAGGSSAVIELGMAYASNEGYSAWDQAVYEAVAELERLGFEAKLDSIHLSQPSATEHTLRVRWDFG